MATSNTDRLEQIELRLARMESRLVQLMIGLKLDPDKRYGAPPPPKLTDRRVK
jgi:hypothetical protein